jgi:hypothetical protein
MIAFIAYAHEDAEFVDRLANTLVAHGIRIWLDRWEIGVGESLTRKINEGLSDFSALIVVLSRVALESDWVNRELSVGLQRELTERSVVILPCLIEDVRLPPLLSDTLWADFRSDFDAGLARLLEGIARADANQRRLDSDEYYVDCAVDWGYAIAPMLLRVTAVETAKRRRHTLITEYEFYGNEEAVRFDLSFQSEDRGHVSRYLMINNLAEVLSDVPFFIELLDQLQVVREVVISDTSSGRRYNVRIKSRRVGEDPGNTTLIDCTSTITVIRDGLKASFGRLSIPSDLENG